MPAPFQTDALPRPDLWPPELIAESDLLVGAMVPRGALWLFISDRNRRAEPVSLESVVPEIRRRIRESIGGATRIPGKGEYCPPAGAPMDEDTLVLLVFLPKRLDDHLRTELLQICVGYGWSTEQEVVLVHANNTTIWLPTGRLLDVMQSRSARPNSSPSPTHARAHVGLLRPRTRPSRPAARKG